jgi:chromosome segregation ATPase
MMHDRMRTAGMAIVMGLFMGGCAGVPSGVLHAEQDDARKRVEAELQDVKAVAESLRAELAAALIAAAKQEAELRELRRQANELQQIVHARQGEMIALREERDRLAQSATVAQVRVADSSTQPAINADVASVQIKLHELESTLAALAAELAQVKKAMTSPSPASSPTKEEEKR